MRFARRTERDGSGPQQLAPRGARPFPDHRLGTHTTPPALPRLRLDHTLQVEARRQPLAVQGLQRRGGGPLEVVEQQDTGARLVDALEKLRNLLEEVVPLLLRRRLERRRDVGEQPPEIRDEPGQFRSRGAEICVA